jgi:hypothetical protein
MLRMAPVEKLCSQFMIGLLVFQPVIQAHQEGMGYRHHCALLALTRDEAAKAGREIRRLGLRRSHARPLRGLPDKRLSALSWFPGQIPAQLAKWCAEGNCYMFTPISAIRLATVTSSTPEMKANCW